MSSPFLAHKRAGLGEDRNRLPGGQVVTKKWPVLTYESELPTVDRETWRLKIFGSVEPSVEISLAELSRMPTTTVTADIHCVTRWSRLKTVWRGVRIRDLLDGVNVSPAASHVLCHSVTGYTSSLLLEDLLDPDDNLIATHADGRELEPEHGGPVRLFVPSLYLWKSVKWVAALEFLTESRRGFWEERGYHDRGRPWVEERYSV